METRKQAIYALNLQIKTDILMIRIQESI